MNISDLIAEFINTALETEGGETELRRADIASTFSCVPSQINYVISSRFTPEMGYSVSSRRGGSGYIKIRRVSDDKAVIMHVVNSIGDEIDRASAEGILKNLVMGGVLTKKECRLCGAACLCPELRGEGGDAVRAAIFKNMLLAVGG